MPSSAMQAACLASSLIFLLVYIPIVIIFTLKLLRIRHNPVYRARLSHIALITIISVIIHILVSAIYLLELGGYIPFNIETFQYVPYFILSYSLFLRFGLYHFQIEFEDLTDNQEWKAIIDGKMEEEMKNNWYLTNKGTYGSWKWLIKRFCILPILGGVILPIIIHSLIGNINNAITALIYFIALILMIILAFLSVAGIAWIVATKLSEFNDVLYVLDEFAKLKWLSLLALIGMAILICSVASFTNNVFEDGHDNNILILMLLEHLSAILLILMVYFSSWWIVTKLVNTRHVGMNKICVGLDGRGSYSATHDSEMSFTSSSITISSETNNNGRSPPSSPKSPKNDNNNNKRLSKLDFLLSYDETMCVFMLHLKKEFQEEILLALIEFTQFRELVDFHLKREENVNNDNDDKKEKESEKLTKSIYGYETLKLAENCPYSSILEGDVPDDIMEQYQDCSLTKKVFQLQYKTHLLFNKYVKSGSALYEINISYHLRNKLSADFGDLRRLVENVNYSKLSSFDGIWAGCLEEQWKYCTNSILRFKQTQGFKRIKEVFAS